MSSHLPILERRRLSFAAFVVFAMLHAMPGRGNVLIVEDDDELRAMFATVLVPFGM